MDSLLEVRRQAEELIEALARLTKHPILYNYTIERGVRITIPQKGPAIIEVDPNGPKHHQFMPTPR